VVVVVEVISTLKILTKTLFNIEGLPQTRQRVLAHRKEAKKGKMFISPDNLGEGHLISQ
jgi:hypothetical protein